MKKSRRLGTLARLAELKETQAVKAIAEFRKNKMIEEQKLGQLEEFRDQYLEGSRLGEHAGVSGSRMQETRMFLDRIAAAIQDQERRIHTVEGQIQTRSAEWNQLRHQRLGFEKLMRKELQDQIRIQEKREQIEIDDRSGQKRDAQDGIESA
ncbi:MAG: flagellar FliJ family protein [Methylococcaceae bacterium]|nr:flagellar FliJ family protein [Methylococcaceae bacterium]